MKKFIFLIIISVSSIYSQKIYDGDFLILESESSKYFYILKNDGYYISEIGGKYTFNKYKEEIPNSLNVPLNTLIPILHKSRTYLLYPGGGLLYTFSNGSITRIDRSFPHRNQFGAYFFSHKENIYLIGGYGYWQTKSIITRFNFNSGDWELVNTKGQQPEGIDQGTYYIEGDKLYVFDFISRQINTQKEKRNDNLYVLDLETFNWQKLGVINDEIAMATQNKGSKRFFKHENKLIFSYSNSPEFFIVDVNKNTFQSFKDEILFYKSENQFIIKESLLIGPIKNTLTGEIRFESFNINNVNNSPITVASYMYRDKSEFFQYVYFAFLSLGILLIALSLYYKRVGQTYIIDDSSISISGVSHQLLPIEISILSLFSKKRSVINSRLMELFVRDDKTKDYAVKKKNKTLLSLNTKLHKLFNIHFIVKQKSEGDSRQLTYVLNKKIRIFEEAIN